jgi:hypothetical protein
MSHEQSSEKGKICASDESPKDDDTERRDFMNIEILPQQKRQRQTNETIIDGRSDGCITRSSEYSYCSHSIEDVKNTQLHKEGMKSNQEQPTTLDASNRNNLISKIPNHDSFLLSSVHHRSVTENSYETGVINFASFDERRLCNEICLSRLMQNAALSMWLKTKVCVMCFDVRIHYFNC